MTYDDALVKAITEWQYDDLHKAHISGHIAHSKTGKLTFVREHDDNRTKKTAILSSTVKLFKGDHQDKDGNIRLHPIRKEEIIHGFFKDRKKAKDAGEIQTVVLTGGPPGAGKSSSMAIHGMNSDILKNFVTADSDAVKKASGYEDQAREIHEESSEINKKITDKAIENGYHTIYDSLLTNLTQAEKVIQKTLKNPNNKVILAFTHIDGLTSVVRAKARELTSEPRSIPVEVSIKGHNRSLPTFLELFRRYGDNPNVHFAAVDNNVDMRNPVPIFKKVGDKTIVMDDNLYKTILTTPYKVIKKDNEEICERINPLTPEHITQAQGIIDQRIGNLTGAINRRAAA